VKTNQPQVLILCGPFVDERHKFVKNLDLEVRLIFNHAFLSVQIIDSFHFFQKPFSDVFIDVMKLIDDSVTNLCTQVVVVPSIYDCQEHITYPVLPLDFKNLSNKIYMVFSLISK